METEGIPSKVAPPMLVDLDKLYLHFTWKKQKARTCRGNFEGCSGDMSRLVSRGSRTLAIGCPRVNVVIVGMEKNVSRYLIHQFQGSMLSFDACLCE